MVDTFLRNSLLEKLRLLGFRITDARASIIGVLIDKGCALSAQDIYRALIEKKKKINVSTIYREVQFLIEQKIAAEIYLKDNMQRYELLDTAHHHHLICLNCKKVDSFEMHDELATLESLLKKEKKFVVRNHALEFFGLCNECENK